MNLARVLLASVVDYAGLFPPAAVSMQEAVENFVSQGTNRHAFMQGSFVVPLVRLDDFAHTLSAVQSLEPFGRAPVSVLLSDVSPDEVSELTRLRELHRELLVVGSVEIRPMVASDIAPARKRLSDDLDCFFEIELTPGSSRCLAAVASVGAKAKVRTGGVTPELIPSPSQVASFIELCADLGLPFKATAGLHHPVRASYPLTYEEGSVCSTMHGFLNVLVASTLRFGGMVDESEMRDVLGETDGSAFQITDETLRWRDRSFGIEQTARCRRSFFQSFGSCSFEEPVRDLMQMGILS